VAVAYTYHELKEKTLQEIAKEQSHEAVQGYSQMNKDHLLPALCKALGIDVHEHHAVSGIDKPAIKMRMRDSRQRGCRRSSPTITRSSSRSAARFIGSTVRFDDRNRMIGYRVIDC
jgi:hypothetical protein